MARNPDDPLSREFRRKIGLLPGVSVVASKTRGAGRTQFTVTATYPDGLAAVCRLGAYANCVLHVYGRGCSEFFYVVVADARAMTLVAETPDATLVAKLTELPTGGPT